MNPLRCLSVMLCVLLALPAYAFDERDPFGFRRDTYTSDADESANQEWSEDEAPLPPYPEARNLYSFYVSATATSRFFVDTQHLDIGKDGVVRYTLMIVSPSGVKNVSYEGIRCETRQKRTYALGRPNNAWSKARGALWTPIRNETTNRYHAALFLDFFCPDGIIAAKAEDVRKAIRKAGEPFGQSN
ncbi:hypothetical protein AGMMS49545_13830 [Betaproteobacteria bacterium]|nr:hypothetical protein AGMMS49545_13830 [Betaproteobacteria bacterium]GHU43570.1 hypothetical protein AGMMS50289_10190 [Betaproteobacteria bacterium]